MEFFKSVLDFVSKPEFWVNVLAALGALKVLARYTPWGWDDKALDYATWLPEKLVSFFKKS